MSVDLAPPPPRLHVLGRSRTCGGARVRLFAARNAVEERVENDRRDAQSRMPESSSGRSSCGSRTKNLGATRGIIPRPTAMATT